MYLFINFQKEQSSFIFNSKIKCILSLYYYFFARKLGAHFFFPLLFFLTYIPFLTYNLSSIAFNVVVRIFLGKL